MGHGVIFDFSGTLSRVEPTAHWLRATLEAAGIEASGDEVARYAALLEEAGALPGGTPPVSVPAELDRVWRGRDLDAGLHRAAYTGLARQVALPWPDLYDALYDRSTTPAAWHPYPDTVEVLTALRARGTAVAVLSNIGWDLRPVLRAHGVAALVDTEVLSYEENLQKPDPRIFRIACDRLGLAPRDVLMVGDSMTADSGATAIGCAFLPVQHLPADRRPNGLRPVLSLVG